MMQVTIPLDPTVVLFYSRIASAAGISLEQVLSDALFKLAGELSLEALQNSTPSDQYELSIKLLRNPCR